MDKIKLTKEKLTEICNDIENNDKMEEYYDAALKNKFLADQHAALVALMISLIIYKRKKLFTNVDPLYFFGLRNFNEQSEFWQYHELLERTNHEILFCLIKNEKIPEHVLVQFCEEYATFLFMQGNYLKCLKVCSNAIFRDENNWTCNFFKSSILEICHINKTPMWYKIALMNYQKELIGKCQLEGQKVASEIYPLVVDEINKNYAKFGETEKQIILKPITRNFEHAKEIVPEWSEEHDFYLRNNLFLSPLSNFDKFMETCAEDFEELSVDKEIQELLNSIIDEYKFCRGNAYAYYKKKIPMDKIVLSKIYSSTYFIFDKIAYLIKENYNLDIPDENVSFSKGGLFNVRIKGTKIQFGHIKNINIVPLYLIMKSVTEKTKKYSEKIAAENALKPPVLQHNELRSIIDHRSIHLVKEKDIDRKLIFLLESARDAILYTYMLLHSLKKDCNENCVSATQTTILKVVTEKNKTSDD